MINDRKILQSHSVAEVLGGQWWPWSPQIINNFFYTLQL